MDILKNLIIWLVVLSFLTTSCRSVKHQEVQETTKETLIEKKVFYHDTVLHVPASSTELSVSLQELLEPKTPGTTFSQTNGNARVQVALKEGRIIATANCDSIALKAKIRRELQKELYLNNKNKKATTKVELPFTYYVLAFVAGFALALLLIIIFKFPKT